MDRQHSLCSKKSPYKLCRCHNNYVIVRLLIVILVCACSTGNDLWEDEHVWHQVFDSGSTLTNSAISRHKLVLNSCRCMSTGNAMDGIMVSPVGRPMWMTMAQCRRQSVDRGTNYQIDRPRTNIGWKTVKSKSSQSVSTKYSLKKRCKSVSIELLMVEMQTNPGAPFWKYRGTSSGGVMKIVNAWWNNLVYFGAIYSKHVPGMGPQYVNVC